MLEKKLKLLGFADKEIKVYLTILNKGQATPTEIAELTGIKRPTVYSITKELAKKGVIEEEKAAKKRRFIALSPDMLNNLARQEEWKLVEKKKLIAEAISAIEEIKKDSTYSIPKISFVVEEELERYLYKQSEIWAKSIMGQDKVWWGYQDPGLVSIYQDWIDWFWKKCAPKNLELKLLTNESEFETEMAKRGYNNRLIKFWKKAGDFTATTWVNGDYLVLISTKQHPYYLVQIHDAILAHNMREMFKSIWKELAE